MVLLTDCHSLVTLSVNRSAVIVPFGEIPAFGVIEPVPQSVHKLKSSLSTNRFVLAHSQRKPFRVFSEIVFPFISVSKYFTPSTIAQWNGEERTFVETYSAGSDILCPVISSICNAVARIVFPVPI